MYIYMCVCVCVCMYMYRRSDTGNICVCVCVCICIGVAIPVSGLKSEESMGIGEFLDLKKLIDWCAQTGLQMIQVLKFSKVCLQILKSLS
jgi:hypothetical protein